MKHQSRMLPKWKPINKRYVPNTLLIKSNDYFNSTFLLLFFQSNEIENNDVIEPDAVIPENYSVPYFSPIIFVPPPIPFVPGKHSKH